MRQKLSALSGIESGKESIGVLLLTQSMLLGIFFGAFDITAWALLLSSFDEIMIAVGFSVSAIAGIFSLTLYSFFKIRLPFRTLAITSLLAVTILTLFLWASLIFIPAKWIIFMVFVLLGPLNILLLSVFRETADRLSDNTHGKKLFRLVENGPIIGTCIISFIIPALLAFKFQPHNILVISAFSIFIATLIQIALGPQLNIVNPAEIQNTTQSEKVSSFISGFRVEPYTRVIAIFAILSVVILFFIQYSFMSVVGEQYVSAEGIARFLGFFAGTMMIFILFVNKVAFRNILHNYGLRTCLIISPLIIALLTAAAITTGLLTGYTIVSSVGFLFFFILLAVSRFISKSLRDSLESSSFKVVYQSINKKIRMNLHSVLAGPIYETTALFSGLILAGLGLLSFIKMVHISMILFFISLAWLFVAYNLYKEFRNSILLATEKIKQSRSEDNISINREILKNKFSANIALRTDYFSLISGDYSVLSNIKGNWYFESIIDYARSRMDINLIPVLKKAASNPDLDEAVRHHAVDTLHLLQNLSTSAMSEDEALSEAKKILAGIRIPQTSVILRLLRNESVELKRMAIFMIGKFRLADLLSEVCEFMKNPELRVDAREVLKAFGSSVEDELIRFSLVTSGNMRLSKTILQLLDKTCSTDTRVFLFSRLWSNSRQLKEIAVKCLINCKFEPTEDEKIRLDQLTSEVIGLITWNLTAKVSLEKDNAGLLLASVNQEIGRWSCFLFNLLSITYNPGIVKIIKENLGRETSESTSYALTIIDVAVTDSIKQKLIAFLDVVSDETKLKNLSDFYRVEIPDLIRLPEEIINRDYNLISLWTKACVLRSITGLEGTDMAESVTALLFCPEELIQEEAAALMARSNPEMYDSVSQRLTGSEKKKLDRIMLGRMDQKEFLFEKVKFLSKYFGSIPEDDLLSLACEMKYFSGFDSALHRFSEGCIIWPLEGFNGIDKVHVLYNGDIDNVTSKYSGIHGLSFYYLPLVEVAEYHFQFPENSFEILKYIDINEIYSESFVS